MVQPSQLFLLADHIKLSLLERQRAISLDLEPNAQDGQISRSLDSLREGIEELEKEHDGSAENSDLIPRLRTQYDDLTSQFRGFPTTSSSDILQPNDPELAPDFSHAAQVRPRNPSSSSFLKRTQAGPTTSSKSVRFSDNSAKRKSLEYDDDDDDPNRASLFPYRDDPDGPPDPSELSNQQVHSYHAQVLREQDEQLDRLGESIGRQRDLSIQIGDELDEHVQMLDEVEVHVDRHQTRLDGARKQLGTVARKARDNKQLTTILILIIILVLLIIILK